MPQISRLVRTAVTAALADPVLGFNANHAAVAASSGVDPIVIDFNLPGSLNFLFGRIAPNLIDESSSLDYPLMTLDTLSARDTHMFVPSFFTGPVSTVIDVHFSWEQSDTLPDFCSDTDAIEDAMFTTMNTFAQVASMATGGVRFNRDMALQRGAIQFGGDNWIQTLSFYFSPDVLISQPC